MFFLIRMAFWLSVVLVLLPSGGAKQTAAAPSAEIGAVEAHANGRSVNDPFTMQHIVHHATRRSPFRQNAGRRARERRASARQNPAAASALVFA